MHPQTHLCDVIELPVEHAHALHVGRASQPAPVRDGRCVAQRLQHLREVDPLAKEGPGSGGGLLVVPQGHGTGALSDPSGKAGTVEPWGEA